MTSDPCFVDVDGVRLEHRWLAPQRTPSPAVAPLVFLHEGLGAVALWRDFPQRVADATGRRALVYSRRGYGASDPLADARAPDFMHDEATRVLPALLARFDVARPVLIGHSDGASIALIHAGRMPQSPVAVIALAPHLFVEPVTTSSIAAIDREFDRGPLAQRMARYHRDPVATFRGWADIWLDARFAAWNIEAEVADGRCPLLAIQGEDDEYGTMAQLDRLQQLRPDARQLRLPGCRHSPHLDRGDAVVAAIAAFLEENVDE